MYNFQTPITAYRCRAQEYKKPEAVPRVTMHRNCNFCGETFVSVKAAGAWLRTCTPCKSSPERRSASFAMA